MELELAMKRATSPQEFDGRGDDVGGCEKGGRCVGRMPRAKVAGLDSGSFGLEFHVFHAMQRHESGDRNVVAIFRGCVSWV